MDLSGSALTWSGDMPENRVSDVCFSFSDDVFVGKCCTTPSCFSGMMHKLIKRPINMSFALDCVIFLQHRLGFLRDLKCLILINKGHLQNRMSKKHKVIVCLSSIN